MLRKSGHRLGGGVSGGGATVAAGTCTGGGVETTGGGVTGGAMVGVGTTGRVGEGTIRDKAGVAAGNAGFSDDRLVQVPTGSPLGLPWPETPSPTFVAAKSGTESSKVTSTQHHWALVVFKRLLIPLGDCVDR